MWQQNEGTSGQQLQRQLTCNKVLHSVSHSSHVFRHIVWSIKGLICKKSASRVAKCAYYLTADRPHRNLPDWRREMQYRGDLQRLETGLWLRGREDTTRRGKKAFWKCFDPLGHHKQKKRVFFCLFVSLLNRTYILLDPRASFHSDVLVFSSVWSTFMYLCMRVWKKKSLFIFLLSVFQILNVTDGGLHIVPWFVVEGELGGVVVGAVTEGPVRSAVSKGTRFAVRRQPVHLFFFIQEREFHFDFNCTTQTRRTLENICACMTEHTQHGSKTRQ